MSKDKPLLGKIIISGVVRCETGLHIGASQETMQIGGVDSPVVRDPMTSEPYIPGSSFRGKLRAIFERIENGRNEDFHFDRYSGQGVWRHECTDPDCPVCRVFGSTAREKNENNIPARLMVRDLKLTGESRARLKEIDTGLQYTELKFENALDRVTASANPRQIERVPAGSEFEMELVYSIENPEDVADDLQNILQLLNVVQDSAIGGHGSRGYGKISIQFSDPAIRVRKIDYYLPTTKNKQEAEQTYTVQALFENIGNIQEFIGASS